MPQSPGTTSVDNRRGQGPYGHDAVEQLALLCEMYPGPVCWVCGGKGWGLVSKKIATPTIPCPRCKKQQQPAAAGEGNA